MDFWGFLGIIVGLLFLLMFLSFLVRRKQERYEDWARSQRRLQLLEIVREVRTEKGDYVSVPRTKKTTPRARPAARRRHK